MSKQTKIENSTTVVASAAMVPPSMAKMLRHFDDPVQSTPAPLHARIYAREGENSYVLQYNGADVLVLRYPANVKPGLRFHSDGDFQSIPFIQQFVAWADVEEPAEVDVEISAPVEWWNVRPQRAQKGEAILGQLGAPLLYGVNGAYLPDWDLLMSWHGLPFAWEGESVTEDETGYHARMKVRMDGTPWVVLLRPHYFHEHLGYRQHEPWKRRPKAEAITGWCSWEAYHSDVTLENIQKTAEALRPLKPYGLTLMQLDDGYQNTQVPCAPGADVGESWLHPNEKFPGGHEAIVEAMAGNGFTPGIWINATLTDKENAESLGCCIKDQNGELLKGDWIQYIMDCTPETLERHVVKCYRQLREKGYRYFKSDSIRHLIYDGFQEAVRRGLMDSETARARHAAYMRAARKGIGEDAYYLSCWGVLSTSIGVCDAMRVATDANPSWRAFSMQLRETARWFFAQRVLFTVDPDHVCVRAQLPWVRMMLSLVSLTGGLMLVSDPPQTYDEARMALMRRTMPSLTTHTGEVGPIDYTTPACAGGLRGWDDERTSYAIAHEKPGTVHPFASLWATHMRKGGRAWCVAQRCASTPVPAAEVSLEAFALDPSRRYCAYDFWADRCFAVENGVLALNALALGDTQVIALTDITDGTPVLVGSDRHVSCDAVSVTESGMKDGHFCMTLAGFEGLIVHYTIYAPGLAGEIASTRGASVQAVREDDYVKVCVTFEDETAQICLA